MSPKTVSKEIFKIQAKFFKALMHPARLAILDLLRESEECVCHMEAVLGYRQAYISQHLMILRDADLVEIRRDGWNIYYQVTKPQVYVVLDAVCDILGQPDASREKVRLPGVCPCPKCNPLITDNTKQPDFQPTCCGED